jgi:hypothetical protein
MLEIYRPGGGCDVFLVVGPVWVDAVGDGSGLVCVAGDVVALWSVRVRVTSCGLSAPECS